MQLVILSVRGLIFHTPGIRSARIPGSLQILDLSEMWTACGHNPDALLTTSLLSFPTHIRDREQREQRMPGTHNKMKKNNRGL